ncbi:MAG: DUF1156 domain-containing protein, partial [Azoarcus sp.]|nr:DUF1156 domain-containing protein [Azoarcus sp.]
MTAIKTPKKLIEVALPLDAINKAAAREKSIRHGHPSTLHLWWARRPLAAARAVIFAQMVNDPGYQQGGGFRYGVNKEKAQAERERLFEIIEDLVKWENTNNEEVLERARAEIRRSWREVCELNKAHPQATELFDPTKLPAFHDPFAGGGALPLEAQRLGLESYASDLNPVAVIINKAMIEIPPRFAGRAPIGSEGVSPSKESKDVSSMNFEGGTPSLPGASFPGARGLAEDVRRYGAWMRAEAEKRIGHLYPQVEITAEIVEERPDLKALLGRKLTVIAWLWARTVKSPNPAFSHVDVPLASTFILSSKAGKESYVQPVVEGDRYRFTVKVGMPPEGARNGTKLARGANFRCVLSDSPIEPNYIKAEGVAGRIGAKLMAIVAEGARGRVYLAPTTEHEAIARQAQPVWKPETVLPDDPRNFWTISYGLTKYGDLFTPRQLVALTTFSDLVGEAIEKCYLGARASRPRNLHHISSEGETPSLPGERLSDVSSPGVSPSSPYHRTHLPHFEAGEFPQHITLRLEDSLPVATLQAWDQELHAITSDTERQRERRQRIEAALDRGLGACWLRNPEVADLVARTLAYFDGTRYRLYAWVIMPNHVHVLVTPLHGYSLSSIVHSWKSFSAKEANTLLGRSGTFWQGDYFDRFIRNAEHWERAISYIHENPVKAGLCATAVEWPWSSVSRSLGSESPGSEGVSPSEKASNIEESRAGRPRSQDDIPLAEGGTGARAYAEAVGVY